MNNDLKLWDTPPVDGYNGREKLKEIEDTLAELEIYLLRNPEDEMARLQYKQFEQKRAALAEASALVLGEYEGPGNAAVESLNVQVCLNA